MKCECVITTRRREAAVQKSIATWNSKLIFYRITGNGINFIRLSIEIFVILLLLLNCCHSHNNKIIFIFQWRDSLLHSSEKCAFHGSFMMSMSGNIGSRVITHHSCRFLEIVTDKIIAVSPCERSVDHIHLSQLMFYQINSLQKLCYETIKITEYENLKHLKIVPASYQIIYVVR